MLLDEASTKLVGYKYFATVSKLMYTCRDKARDIYATFARWFGYKAAAFAKQVPPKCISGRWGAISACEDSTWFVFVQLRAVLLLCG